MVQPNPTLSPAETTELTVIAECNDLTQVVRQRARIILLSSLGLGNSEIARHLGVSRPTVIAIRHKFLSASEDRVAAILQKARKPPAKHLLVTASALYDLPRTAARWSTRVAARESGLSRSAVQRAWRARGVVPVDFGIDLASVALPENLGRRITDVVGIYHTTLDWALAFAADTRPYFGAELAPALRQEIRQRGERLLQSVRALEKIAIGPVMPCLEVFVEFLTEVVDRNPGKEIHVLVQSPDEGAHQFGPTVREWLTNHSSAYLHPTPIIASSARPWERWGIHWIAAVARQTAHADALRSADSIQLKLMSFAAAPTATADPLVILARP